MAGWNTDTRDFAKAVAEFEAALPGFWWRVGQCSVGAHASCAVDRKGCQAELLKGVKTGGTLHSGFHCDTRGGAPSEALRDVMEQALEFLRTSRCAAIGASRRRCRGHGRALQLVVGWNTDTKDLARAVAEIETALPGFWWLVGHRSVVGPHAACGVDGAGCQADLLEGVKGGDTLDRGFGCDTRGKSSNEALRDVMEQALEFLRTSRCAAIGASRRRRRDV